MSEFAGSLRERVTIERRHDARDALARGRAQWRYDGAGWVSVTPLIPADLTSADALSALPRWQVIMRKREDIGLWTRLVWRGRFLAVRNVISDPRDPSRMVMQCEEAR
jgi:head-tail adaptor